MKSLLPYFLILLLGILALQVYQELQPPIGTFALESGPVSQGGALTGLLALGAQGNIRPAEQIIPTELRILEVGDIVRASVRVEAPGEKELEIEYYILDIGAERINSGRERVLVGGKEEILVELKTPEEPGKYILHVTVKAEEGISTDMAVFQIE